MGYRFPIGSTLSYALFISLVRIWNLKFTIWTSGSLTSLYDLGYDRVGRSPASSDCANNLQVYDMPKALKYLRYSLMNTSLVMLTKARLPCIDVGPEYWEMMFWIMNLTRQMNTIFNSDALDFKNMVAYVDWCLTIKKL